MSGLIKSIRKGVKKAFKFVKKVVKKVAKSKIFKAIVIAAAVYFTAGAAAGFLSSTGGMTAAATTNAATQTALSTAGTAAATTAASSGVGAMMGTLGKGAIALGKTALANPQITSTALTIGGGLLAAKGQADAAEDAYNKDRADLMEANKTELPIAERLSKYTPQGVASRFSNTQEPQASKSAGHFFDHKSNTYKAV